MCLVGIVDSALCYPDLSNNFVEFGNPTDLELPIDFDLTVATDFGLAVTTDLGIIDFDLDNLDNLEIDSNSTLHTEGCS